MPNMQTIFIFMAAVVKAVHRRMLERNLIIYMHWPILFTSFLANCEQTINTAGYCIYATSIREMEISCFTSPHGLSALNSVLPRANTTSAFLFTIWMSCRNEVVLSSEVMRRNNHFLLRCMYSINGLHIIALSSIIDLCSCPSQMTISRYRQMCPYG